MLRIVCKYFLLIFLASNNGYCRNFHEHFYSTFSYQNIKDAYDRIAKPKKFENQKISIFLKEDSSLNHLKSFISKTFGIDELATLDKLNLDMSLLSVAQTIFPNEEHQLNYFFQGIDEVILNPIEIYKNKENFRKFFLKNLKKYNFSLYEKLIVEAYSNFIASTPREDHKYILTSLPGDLVDSEIIIKIKKMFIKNDSELKLLYSYPRYKLLADSNESFEEKYLLIETNFIAGVIDGVDISGSIEEKNDKHNYHSILYRLKRLSNLFTQRGAFKIHMFEAANKGTFYDAMNKLFEYWNRNPDFGPKNIIFGHIFALNEESLAIIRKKLYDRNLLFEYNLFSNLALNPEAGANDILSKVDMVLRHGLPVCPGGDGVGLLEIKNFQEELRTISLESNFNHEIITSQLFRCMFN